MLDRLDKIFGKLFLINAAIEQQKDCSSDMVGPMLAEVIEELIKLKDQPPEPMQPTRVELPIDALRNRPLPLDIVLNVLDLLHVIEYAVETPESREHLFGPLTLAKDQLYLVRDALEGK